MKRRLSLAALLILLIVGCSNRERRNPLDAANPETGGLPQGLKVSALRHQVNVSWREPDVEDLLGVQIYHRSGEDDDAYALLTTVDPGIMRYVDAGRAYEVPVSYRIAYLGEDWVSPLSEAMTILPGPHSFWVCDYYAGTLSRMSYDAGQVVFAMPFAFFPTDVAVDTLQARVWATDWTGLLLNAGLGGESPQWIEGFTGPTRLALDAVAQRLWVLHQSGSEVVTLDLDGAVLDRQGGFASLIDVAADGAGGCWTADRDDSTLIYLAPGGFVGRTPLTGRPQALATAERGLWLALDRNVTWISSIGALTEVAALADSIVAISAVDTMHCWALTVAGDGQGMALKVAADGHIQTEIFGFYKPSDIVAVPSDGGCLVVDRGQQRLLRYDGQGQLKGLRTGLMSPDRAVLE